MIKTKYKVAGYKNYAVVEKDNDFELYKYQTDSDYIFSPKKLKRQPNKRWYLTNNDGKIRFLSKQNLESMNILLPFEVDLFVKDLEYQVYRLKKEKEEINRVIDKKIEEAKLSVEAYG